jgi:dolichol-phosphate mannosyltransferase
MNISIITPCYNEAENVSKLRSELLPVVEALVLSGWENAEEKVNSAEIIFIDDGSRDETLEKLQEAFSDYKNPNVEFKYIKHETNLGLGAAIRTGFQNSSGEIVMTVDSDGTYKFSEIPVLLSLLTPGVDIVTASPYHPQGSVIGVPAYRLILSRGSSLIYRILVYWRIYTYTCLFRAYRRAVIKNISFKSNGFLAGTEILVKALLKGYRVAEFPAILTRRMYGVSKAKIAQTITSHLLFQCWVFVQRVRLLFGIKPERIN